MSKKPESKKPESNMILYITIGLIIVFLVGIGIYFYTNKEKEIVVESSSRIDEEVAIEAEIAVQEQLPAEPIVKGISREKVEKVLDEEINDVKDVEDVDVVPKDASCVEIRISDEAKYITRRIDDFNKTNYENIANSLNVRANMKINYAEIMKALNSIIESGFGKRGDLELQVKLEKYNGCLLNKKDMMNIVSDAVFGIYKE